MANPSTQFVKYFKRGLVLNVLVFVIGALAGAVFAGFGIAALSFTEVLSNPGLLMANMMGAIIMVVVGVAGLGFASEWAMKQRMLA